MFLGLLLAVCCATALAAPASTVKPETLSALVNNLKPEEIKTLKNASLSLEISKAAASPENPLGTESSADLNLQSNILVSVIRGILNLLNPAKPTTPAPSFPSRPNSGNGNFQPTSGFNFFNPFGLFGGSNTFFPGFMFDMFENFW